MRTARSWRTRGIMRQPKVRHTEHKSLARPDARPYHTDPDRSRAETLADFAPSRRRKAKMGDRQYFYAPVDMNRWVVAAELEDE
jgi:hypothetical protein